jgi:hypothetical protein
MDKYDGLASLKPRADRVGFRGVAAPLNYKWGK